MSNDTNGAVKTAKQDRLLEESETLHRKALAEDARRNDRVLADAKRAAHPKERAEAHGRFLAQLKANNRRYKEERRERELNR